MKLWNFRGEKNSIAEALDVLIPEHAVISITGAGGKTSLVFAWARELASSGRRTAVTTTTHMLHPDMARQGADPDPYAGISVIYADDPAEKNSAGTAGDELLAEIDRVLDEKGIVLVVSPDPDRPAKVTALPQWVLDHLYKTADAVLIEADGSRRMPFKWPASHEPVVPENTDITVCVAGMSALGKRTQDVMYQADLMPDGLKRDIVDETLIGAVMASPDGGRKGEQGEFRVFLNQTNDADLCRSASRIQMYLAVCGIQSAWGTLL